jgi:hypothetical protein
MPIGHLPRKLVTQRNMKESLLQHPSADTTVIKVIKRGKNKTVNFILIFMSILFLCKEEYFFWQNFCVFIHI